MDNNEVFANIPYVIERSAQGERSYDLYSRLLKDRIIFLGTGVNDQMANAIVAQLLFLNKEDASSDIQIYVNSPGGSVTSGLAIYDTIQHLNCDVATYCMGQAASMGAVLLSAGTSGKRYSLPNSRIMIHQPWGGYEGTCTDINIHAKEITRLKLRLNEILAKHCGKTVEELEKATDRDNFLSAEEAKEFGLIDHVL